MDNLNRYIGLDIPDNAIDHVRTMIWLAAEVNVDEETKDETFCEIDKKLRFKAYTDCESKVTFNNLKDLCKYYYDQFRHDIRVNIDTNTDILPSDPDELTAYMASNFGVTY
ncbi:MAG: hypothetical protein K5776_09915 [Lachnospiraceae bacterium]|nr:hypothetical protein [Lachnospiraceae bacterium]